LALKSRKPVVLLAVPPAARDYFTTLGGAVRSAESVDEAILEISKALAGSFER
jgi:hypothetical protein